MYAFSRRIRSAALAVFFLGLLQPLTAQQLYWIDGPGNWDDLNHWSEQSGDRRAGPAGYLPDENIAAIIDKNSGLKTGDILNIPTGTFSAQDLIDDNPDGFTLNFSGVPGSSTRLELYGNLKLTNNVSVTYASSGSLYNRWRFTGPNQHTIQTSGKDLLYVEFFDEDGQYEQLDALTASEKIRMYGGEWFTNGNDVQTNYLQFKDNNSTSNPLTKVFNAGGSDIHAEEWRARLTYGSLTVTGSYRIFTKRFVGSPAQPFAPTPLYDEIHLLEDIDPPFPAAGSAIESNHFECTGCAVNDLIIENDGITQLAMPFTINDQLTVTKPESTVRFNGGNARPDEITLDGNVSTPPVNNVCDQRTIFTAVYTSGAPVNLMRASGTLTISDAEIVDIQTSGGGSFNLNNGLLSGSSTGWNLVNNPLPREMVWVGGNGHQAGDWNDLDNWRLNDRSRVRCLPTLNDNVSVDRNAGGSIRIPNGYTAECKDLTWTNQDGYTLTLDGLSPGNNSAFSRLLIGGDLRLDQSASIQGLNSHAITFLSTETNVLETRGVALPEITFAGPLASWTLQDDLTCSELRVSSGTLRTNNRTVRTDYFGAQGDEPIVYDFGSSDILVAGEFKHSSPGTTNITILPSTSLIECESFTALDATVHDLRLVNTSPISLNGFDLTANDLILAGTAPVSVAPPVFGVITLEVNELTFGVDNATLKVNPNFEFIVNEGIRSQASATNPALLQSSVSGTRVEITSQKDNLCIEGPLEFQDVESALPGVTHAPQGTDQGNTLGINFAVGNPAQALYWIGGDGVWKDSRNWSAISGGCPAGAPTINTDSLVIDGNGLFTATDTIRVLDDISNGTVYFQNNDRDVVVEVSTNFTTESLTITTARVDWVGTTADVVETTLLELGGVFVTKMNAFTTKALTTESGVCIVRPGATLTVTAQ